MKTTTEFHSQCIYRNAHGGRRPLRSFFRVCQAVVTLATSAASAYAEVPSAQITPATAAVDVVINPQSRTSDSQPSFVVTPKGDHWMAWRGYQYGQERIFACAIGPDRARAIKSIAPSWGIHAYPHLVATRQQDLWAVWTSRNSGTWKILARRATNGDWMPREIVSDDVSNAIRPTAAELSTGSLIVAWQDYHAERFRIVVRTFDGDTWSTTRVVSDQQADAFRPILVADNQAQMWCFWDSYVEGNYAVFGRVVSPSLKPIERVTPVGESCLTPVTAFSTRHGLCVACLRLEDVRAGEGAIDQLHTLHVDRRTESGWRRVTTTDGNAVAASLTHGLLARMAPNPGGIHGYTGRRRHPMLLVDGDRLWLLWERKMHHDGLASPMATGQLLGRRLAGEHWDEPVILHSGYVDYHMPDPAVAVDGKTFAVASQLPQYQKRIYHRFLLDLNQGSPLEPQRPHGWTPTRLPHADSIVDRQHVVIDGQTLNVYWADLHCHSGLTADAEGEIDELIHYARDRARLDVVVVQENDVIYDCPLTESEYAIGVFHSNAYSRNGKFLALPGFEWTARLPSHDEAVPTVQPPWRRAFPNHRTIIYPPPGGPIVRHSENGNNMLQLADVVEKAGGIMHTQHQEFKLSGRSCEVNIEVASGWRTFIFKPEFIHRTLDAGPHLGFVATSDTHRRNPGLGGGLTAICAESLTPDAILDALRNRRCWATNGSRILLDARANGRFMGEVLQCGPEVKHELTVRGTRPIVRATLVRDGQDQKTFEGNSSSRLEAEWVERLPPGRHWCYWRVEQEGSSPQYPSNVKVAFGNFAWSSPHYVYVE